MSSPALVSSHRMDRRRSFRIDDKVAMKVRVVDEDGYANAASRSKTQNLVTHLAYESEQHLSELRIIEKHYPSVAAYLKLLERKIELLAQHTVRKNAGLPHAPTNEVNLSAQGMRFQHEVQLRSSTLIEIELCLFPTNILLLLYARVLWCKQLGQPPRAWTAVVEFDHIDETAREALAKHIHLLQLNQLRR